MTIKNFLALKERIRSDPNSVKTNWYDGHKWTDPQGNWYGWESCGYVEYVFYAGDTWEVRYGANGQPTDPVKFGA